MAPLQQNSVVVDRLVCYTVVLSTEHKQLMDEQGKQGVPLQQGFEEVSNTCGEKVVHVIEGQETSSQAPKPSQSTRKYRSFVNSTMEGKSVLSVPGVGKVTAQRLQDSGIFKATELFGVFLRDKEGFKAFMKGFGADRNRQSAAFKAFEDWYTQHM